MSVEADGDGEVDLIDTGTGEAGIDEGSTDEASVDEAGTDEAGTDEAEGAVSTTEAPTPTVPPEPEPAPARVALDDLLDTLEDAGYINADGAVADAEATIQYVPTFVVVGGRPDDEDVSATAFLAQLVEGLVAGEEGESRVAVGDAAVTDPLVERSPLVNAVREDGDTWEAVTSVDALEAFAGLAALTLGIDDLRVGRTGHYGVGDSADSLLPVDP
jgi:hypothetical protein